MSLVLITGATDGIGRAAALRLAAAGHDVILHGRNPEKLEAARQAVAAEATGSVAAELADLADLQQVAGLAAKVGKDYPGLNVLVNNAGLLTDHRQESTDGFELTFAVNYLAPFLLTNLLLETLQANAPARVVNVASSAMGGAELNFEDLQFESAFEGWQAYANSKLANVLFSNLLAEKLEGTGVVSNSCCPGLIDTNFFHTNTLFAGGAYERMKTHMRQPEQGADIPVYMADSAETAAASGKFYLRRPDLGLGDEVRSMPLNWSREDAAMLWGMSESLAGEWL